MNTPWRYAVALRKLCEGLNNRQAAEIAGLTRQSLWKRMKASPEFAEAVAQAREAGKHEREFRAWLFHPFRGRRPPAGKCHGGKPRYRYGQGARR